MTYCACLCAKSLKSSQGLAVLSLLKLDDVSTWNSFALAERLLLDVPIKYLGRSQLDSTTLDVAFACLALDMFYSTLIGFLPLFVRVCVYASLRVCVCAHVCVSICLFVSFCVSL